MDTYDLYKTYVIEIRDGPKFAIVRIWCQEQFSISEKAARAYKVFVISTQSHPLLTWCVWLVFPEKKRERLTRRGLCLAL